MNEVSLRNSVLDTIDELNSVVTESADDVLYSLIDAADKAVVIMENCEDTDDVWKYSIWQEADENAIDKDKNPFKESSTLKTILMLPINLIRYIWKTISSAFNPQQVQETSKAAAAAAKVGGVVHKVLPFFFKEDGTVNLPVVIATGAGGAVLTLDGLIRKAGSVPARIWRAVTNAIKRILVKIRGVKATDIPDADCFKIDEKDGKFIVNIDITKSAAFIDKADKLIEQLPVAIEQIKNITDEKKTEELAGKLRSEVSEVLKICPVTKERKTYTAEELAKFYQDTASNIAQLPKDEIDKFTKSYTTAVGDKNKDKKAFTQTAKTLGVFFDVVNAYVSAVDGIGKTLKNIGTINAEIEKLADEQGVSLNGDGKVASGEEATALQQQAKNSEEGQGAADGQTDAATDAATEEPEEPTPTDAAAESNAETATGETSEESIEETKDKVTGETPAPANNAAAATEEKKAYTKGDQLGYSEGIEVVHAAYNGSKKLPNEKLSKSYNLRTENAKAGLKQLV